MARDIQLSPDQLLPPLVQMRDELDPDALRELAASIKSRGLLHPVVVTRVGDRWRVIAGFRRLRAAQEAGLALIPCREIETDEVGEVELMAVENIQREDANPLEEGRVFAIIREAKGLTVEEVSRLVGRSPSYVHARLGLLEAPADVQKALRDGSVSLSVARELARCLHDEDRAYLLYHAAGGGATTDTVRRWVTEAVAQRASRPEGPPPPLGEPPMGIPSPPTASCEWCQHERPLDSIISMRVDGDCYLFLQQLRDRTAVLTSEPQEGGPDVEGA